MITKTCTKRQIKYSELFQLYKTYLMPNLATQTGLRFPIKSCRTDRPWVK